MSTPLLEVELTAGYGPVTTVHDVRLCLAAGERTGVVGTSGAGKSTLVLALLGMLPWRNGWAKGHVRLRGRDLLRCGERELRSVRGKDIALVPQSPSTALNPALSLQAHFDEVWRAHSAGSAGKVERMQRLLCRVELPFDTAFLKRLPSQISIGQAQRVMIALALLHAPSLLIADEPSSALDVCTQREIVSLLYTVSREEGTTLLYVSHDLVSVLQLCERMVVMSHGSLVESLDLRPDLLVPRHAVTRDLLHTLPASPLAIRQACKALATPAGTCTAEPEALLHG